MILFTNGCSWTWGGGLEPFFMGSNNLPDHDRRLKLLWPEHLGKLLNADKTVNLSDGCGSNQRIMRTTYRWLLEQSEEDLKQTIPVLQFTEWSRLEIYDGNKNDYADDLGKWLKCKIDVVCTESGSEHIPTVDAGITIKKIQDRILDTSDIENYYRTISYLYSLKGMFNSFGIDKFYIWHFNHVWWQWPEQYKNRLYKDFNVLDMFHSSNDVLNNGWKYGRVSEQDLHPGVDGHAQIAHIIYHLINQKNYR